MLHSKLHYRILEYVLSPIMTGTDDSSSVSSFKELASRMYPDLPRPKKSDSAHRAMSDIEDSIAGVYPLPPLACTLTAAQSSSTTKLKSSNLRPSTAVASLLSLGLNGGGR